MGSIPVGATGKTPPCREEFFIWICSIPFRALVNFPSLSGGVFYLDLFDSR